MNRTGHYQSRVPRDFTSQVAPPGIGRRELGVHTPKYTKIHQRISARLAATCLSWTPQINCDDFLMFPNLPIFVSTPPKARTPKYTKTPARMAADPGCAVRGAKPRWNGYRVATGRGWVLRASCPARCAAASSLKNTTSSGRIVRQALTSVRYFRVDARLTTCGSCSWSQ